MSRAGSASARCSIARWPRRRPTASRWCASSAEPSDVQDEVLALLKSHDDSHGFLEPPALLEPGHAGRRVSHRSHPRPRRHGRRLSRPRHAAASRGRVEGAAAALVPRRSHAGAAAPGSARRGGAVASVDRHGVTRSKRSAIRSSSPRNTSKAGRCAKRLRGGPLPAAARARDRARRSPRRCRPRTIAASCIAISSRRTSSSPRTAA